MGTAEILAGFFARSQALKADALDFLGDGAITFLGLVALQRSRYWRAGSALLQACFLGLMAAGVIAATLYRVFIQQVPEAGTMGMFGVAALAVNIVAAMVLVPHRQGDASVRAVWLFSRNDAVGNVAVIVASGLVAWTHTPWPDLIVAVIIAALFLHSAWEIFTSALRELQEIRPAGMVEKTVR
jgi:Co/Zn/Cd efflux system component